MAWPSQDGWRKVRSMYLGEQRTKPTLKAGLMVESVRAAVTHCRERTLELMFLRESFLEEGSDVGPEGKGKRMRTTIC